VKNPRERLAMICARPEPEWDLAEASLLVAATEYADLDPREGLALLDELGRRAVSRLRADEPRRRAFELARYLHEEERFDGNREDYDDPRNSYMNEVLSRRTGLPILLSIVYVEVGRRAGVALQGVGLPGHYIVKVPGPAEIFIDPFNGGDVISVEECADRVKKTYGDVPFSKEMLRAATPRGTLARLVRNLKAVYAGRNDVERTWRMTDLILCVDPRQADELRDRGLLALRLDRPAAAADDLSRYLEARPAADDRDEIVKALRAARMAIASRN
jgi:regulator of sirC expression with transglutaminase-like and TPR domain